MDPISDEYQKLPSEQQEAIELGHEPRTINVRGVVRFVYWFIGSALVIHVVVYFMLVGFERYTAPQQTAPSALADQRTGPPSPRLQRSPGYDMQEMHRAENEVFRQMGWLDQQSGGVRIPDEIAQKVIQMSAPQDGSQLQAREGAQPGEQNGGAIPRVLRQRQHP